MVKAEQLLDVRGVLSQRAHFTFLAVSVLLLWSTGKFSRISEWPVIILLICGFFGCGIVTHFMERLFLRKRKKEMWDLYEQHGEIVLAEIAPKIAFTSNLLALVAAASLNLVLAMIVGR